MFNSAAYIDVFGDLCTQVYGVFFRRYNAEMVASSLSEENGFF